MNWVKTGKDGGNISISSKKELVAGAKTGATVVQKSRVAQEF